MENKFIIILSFCAFLFSSACSTKHTETSFIEEAYFCDYSNAAGKEGTYGQLVLIDDTKEMKVYVIKDKESEQILGRGYFPQTNLEENTIEISQFIYKEDNKLVFLPVVYDMATVNMFEDATGNLVNIKEEI